MIFFFPIGHEENVVRRWPAVTFAVIGLCLVAHAVLYPMMERDDEERRRFADRVDAFKGEMYWKHGGGPRSVMDAAADSNARSLADLGAAMKAGVAAFWDAFVAGRVVPKDHEDYKRYVALEDDGRERERHTVLGRLAFRPDRAVWYTYFTALFIHAGLLHLLGNLYFLYLVGAALEDRWGRVPFALLYLGGGVAAFAVHGLVFPHDARPAIGASGAVSAAMGAFAVRFWRTRVRFWFFYVLLRVHQGTFGLPAFVVLPAWAGYQVLLALFLGDATNVAYLAHVGGFAFGAMAAGVVAWTGIERRVLAPAVARKAQRVVHRSDERLVRARVLLAETRPDEAAALLVQVLAERPDDLTARREMLRAFLLQGRNDDARAEAREAIERLVAAGETEEAADVFAEAAPAVPDLVAEAAAQFAVAQALDRRKDHANAARAYRNLAEKWRDFGLAPKALVAAARLFRERLDDAKAAFGLYRKFLERYPKDPLAGHVREQMRAMTGGQVVFEGKDE